MTPQTAAKLVFMTVAAFPQSANKEIEPTAELWLDNYKNKPDDLMETAVRLAINSCKYFPTLADINQAIKDLAYEEQTQPKMLPPRSRRTEPAIVNAFAMVKSGQAKELLASMDIADVMEYAKVKFPDISESTVRRNYSELAAAMECSEMCFQCRWKPNQCTTGGWYVVPRMESNGWIKNDMARCQKNVKV